MSSTIIPSTMQIAPMGTPNWTKASSPFASGMVTVNPATDILDSFSANLFNCVKAIPDDTMVSEVLNHPRKVLSLAN